MRTPDAPFAEAAESFMRSRHDLRPWTKRSYAKGLARLESFLGARKILPGITVMATEEAPFDSVAGPTISDLTLDNINAYLAAKIASGATTLAHHDGGLAKRLAAWLVQASELLEHRREVERKYRDRRRTDPEWLARKRAYQRAYVARKKITHTESPA